MTNQLTQYNHNFNGTKIQVINKDGDYWITNRQIAEALEYDDKRAISKIYNRNKELLSDYSGVVNLTTSAGGAQHTRVFNQEGVMLIAMKSHQKKAIEFQKWAVKVLKEYKTTGLIRHTPAEQKHLLTLDQASRTREVVFKFIDDCSSRYAPKGYAIRYSHSNHILVYNFIKLHYDISSYKDLESSQIDGLFKVLVANEQTIFNNKDKIFGLNIGIKEDNKAMVISQDSAEFSIKDNGKSYTFSLQLIADAVNFNQAIEDYKEQARLEMLQEFTLHISKTSIRYQNELKEQKTEHDAELENLRSKHSIELEEQSIKHQEHINNIESNFNIDNIDSINNTDSLYSINSINSIESIKTQKLTPLGETCVYKKLDFITKETSMIVKNTKIILEALNYDNNGKDFLSLLKENYQILATKIVQLDFTKEELSKIVVDNRRSHTLAELKQKAHDMGNVLPLMVTRDEHKHVSREVFMQYFVMSKKLKEFAVNLIGVDEELNSMIVSIDADLERVIVV